MFQQALVNESNITLTENGAITNASTLNNLLDFFYHAPAKRGQAEVEMLFHKAFSSEPGLATRIMFYLRDPRGGQGERDSFRKCLAIVHKENHDIFTAVAGLVSEYGRWDDILSYVDDEYVNALVAVQLHKDLGSMAKGESVSLLAKWMPSINTSSKETKTLGRKWAKVLSFSEKKYRQTLSALRAHIDIVESKMSANKWSDVNYSAVPSRASLLYKEAFKKHDATRYEEFTTKAVNGEVKINSAVLFPYDIISKYGVNSGWGGSVDPTLEALWKQLPNYADTTKNALVVADVSGSMSGTPLEVCISLAIYIAERNSGCFKDQFITFSTHPKLEMLVGKTLRERINNLSQANWDMSTNLEAVFDLVLTAAVNNNISQDELPDSIFIISDMEFDRCVGNSNMTNFKNAQKKFTDAGYTLPKIIFWNVASRNTQSPVTKDEKGVYLVSGNSPSIFQKAVNATATTPIEMMMEVLDNPRYAAVKAAIESR
jgi:hypothetical protein